MVFMGTKNNFKKDGKIQKKINIYFSNNFYKKTIKLKIISIFIKKILYHLYLNN
jgi:hypothetical protein